MIKPRTPRRVGIITVLVLTFAALPPVAGAEADVSAAVKVLHQGLASGDASRLRSILPGKGKIHFSLPSLTSQGGYFSSGQLQILLSELFRRHPVSAVDLSPPGDPGDDRVMVRGKLVVRQEEEDGGKLTLTIHFLLSREDEGWVLREIREY